MKQFLLICAVVALVGCSKEIDFIDTQDGICKLEDVIHFSRTASWESDYSLLTLEPDKGDGRGKDNGGGEFVVPANQKAYSYFIPSTDTNTCQIIDRYVQKNIKPNSNEPLPGFSDSLLNGTALDDFQEYLRRKFILPGKHPLRKFKWHGTWGNSGYRYIPATKDYQNLPPLDNSGWWKKWLLGGAVVLLIVLVKIKK